MQWPQDPSVETHAQRHSHIFQLPSENQEQEFLSGHVCGPVCSGSWMPEKPADGVVVQ